MIIYNNYSIDDSRISGSQGKTTCPKCIELGKQNIKDTCLSVNRRTKVFLCHKCGFTGYFGEPDKGIIQEYTKPNTQNLTSLKDEHLIQFTKRGITQDVVLRNGIKSARGDWWAFPYFEGDDIVNIKSKSIDSETGKKKLYQAKDAKQIVYKYNDIIDAKEIIICEGEEDALSWEVAGVLHACSVSQGAPNESDKSVEKKLACIYNCFDTFEKAEIIYLAADNDSNGKRLNNELIKIFTPEKCKIVDFKDCNDSNEYLVSHGKESLLKLLETANDVKIDGIYECQDFFEEILSNYRNGQPRGTTTYFENIDKCWTHRSGEVTIWTGYNNEGKSLLLKQLLLIKSLHDGWRHAIFSPEEVPLSEFYTDLIESYIGKSADIYQKSYNNYMNEMQVIDGRNFMQEYFHAVYPSEDHSLEEILKKASYLVRKKKIKTVTLDPYNQIHHKMKTGEREDLYISRFMAKLKKFAVDHDVAVHLVAHQSTPILAKGENYPMPNIYKIKGGGTFGDKADNVNVVWRENRNTDQTDPTVKFISQKIKKQKLTGIPGEAELIFDRSSNRYYTNGVSPFDLNRQPVQQEFQTNKDLTYDPDAWLSGKENEDSETPF